MSWPAQPGESTRWSRPPAGEAGDGSWGRPNQSARRWWLAAVVLLVAAAVALTIGLTGLQRSLPGPLFRGSTTAPVPKVSLAARSVPVTLTIPAIHVNVPLSQLGLNPDGTAQVPSSFQEPGWYRLGPSPGQMGSAVILGHVDSYQGPAVFFQLRTLRPGDGVNVALADGVITHFVVRQVAMYSKADFPTVSVYGSHGYSGLQLVTCGGVFDSQTGHYLSNVVVYTSLVGTSKPGTPA